MNGHQELAGRVAVVTGAGRNIGRAIALALADGGAAVVVNGRSNKAQVDDVVREIEAGGGRAFGYLADVADADGVHAMAKAA
ncbi:MAG: SDR family NAD(P)-dependent oxidoreductase, partial [Xanthobacteraceae bacterium]